MGAQILTSLGLSDGLDDDSIGDDFVLPEITPQRILRATGNHITMLWVGAQEIGEVPHDLLSRVVCYLVQAVEQDQRRREIPSSKGRL